MRFWWVGTDAARILAKEEGLLVHWSRAEAPQMLECSFLPLSRRRIDSLDGHFASPLLLLLAQSISAPAFLLLQSRARRLVLLYGSRLCQCQIGCQTGPLFIVPEHQCLHYIEGFDPIIWTYNWSPLINRPLKRPIAGAPENAAPGRAAIFL